MSEERTNPDAETDRTTEFVRLLNRHERCLAAYVLGLVSHWVDADEIMQETRIRLWQQFQDYQPDKDFGSWACTIAYYQVLSHRKRQGQERARFNDAFAEKLAQLFAALPQEPGPRQSALSVCLEKLSRERRELLRQYYSREATIEELARRQSRTTSAIYKLLTVARAWLYQCIKRTLREEQQ